MTKPFCNWLFNVPFYFKYYSGIFVLLYINLNSYILKFIHQKSVV